MFRFFFLYCVLSQKLSIQCMIEGHKKNLEGDKENLGGIAPP